MNEHNPFEGEGPGIHPQVSPLMTLFMRATPLAGVLMLCPAIH